MWLRLSCRAASSAPSHAPCEHVSASRTRCLLPGPTARQCRPCPRSECCLARTAAAAQEHGKSLGLRAALAVGHFSSLWLPGQRWQRHVYLTPVTQRNASHAGSAFSCAGDAWMGANACNRQRSSWSRAHLQHRCPVPGQAAALPRPRPCHAPHPDALVIAGTDSGAALPVHIHCRDGATVGLEVLAPAWAVWLSKQLRQLPRSRRTMLRLLMSADPECARALFSSSQPDSALGCCQHQLARRLPALAVTCGQER